jgi:hypothetical protein
LLRRDVWWKLADVAEVFAVFIIGAMRVSTPETSMNFYQTTLRNNPEDSRLRTRCREDLNPHAVKLPDS